MKKFFEDKGLLVLVDRLAKRYGRLPSEILNELSINDFNINVAVMLTAEVEGSKDPATKVPTSRDDLKKKFKLDVKVVKKGKGKK